MTPEKRIRKPTDLTYHDEYAGIMARGEEPKDKRIYIGGRYYEDFAQIHLNAKEARRLAAWLEKAADYLEQKEKMK